MPLDPTSPSHRHGLPGALPWQPPSTADTAPVPSVGLDTLPPEILVRIATDLDDRSLIALGVSCVALHAALRADRIRPLQLEGRLRWTTTLTQLYAVIGALDECSRPGRQRLLEVAWARTGRLHPALQDRARKALRASATPQSVAAQLHHRIGSLPTLPEGVRTMRTRTLDTLLSEIENSHADQDGELLTHWLRAAGCAGMLRRTPAQWRARMADMSEAGAMSVLGALVDALHGVEDGSRWYEIVRLALDSALTHAREHGWTSSWQTELLCAVARALAASTAGDAAIGPRRAPLWRELFDLVPALGASAGAAVLSTLAMSAAAIDMQEPTCSPRWLALIDAARTLPSQGATADVLEAIIDHCSQRERPQQRDWRQAVMSAAQPLGQPEQARVLLHLLECPPPHDAAWRPAMWDTLFAASASTACHVQALMLSTLARLVTGATVDAAGATLHTAPQCVARWMAVLDRCMGLADEGQRLHGLIGLLLAGPQPSYSCQETALRAHRDMLLLGAGARLPVHDRARLLVVMLAMQGRVTTPESWRLAVDTAIALPPALRFGPMAGLAHRLLTFDHHFPATLVAAISPPSPPWTQPEPPRPPGPGEPGVGTWPNNAWDARRHLSVLLRMLALPERARLLLALATASPSATAGAVLWLLDEGRALPHTGRHGVALVQEVAAWVARSTANEGGAVLPTLWQDVLALAAEHRAAALLHIGDFVQRHGCDPGLAQSLAAQLAALPAHDRGDARVLSADERRPYKRKGGPDTPKPR